MTTCCEKAKHCDFETAELDERIIELVIASTSFDFFQKELLEKPKGLKIDEILAEGHKYEAMATSKQCLQSLNGKSALVDAMQQSRKACSNCNLTHQLRKCPAYNDTCKACGSKGHWAKCCRKSKRKQQKGKPNQRQRSASRGRSQSRSRTKGARSKSRDGSRPVDLMQDNHAQHYTATDNQDDDQSQVDLLYSIHIFDLSMTPVQPNKLDEAFRIIDVECPSLHGVKRLKLKVDTGASANTLPLRTVRQMYGDNWSSQTRRTNVRLTAYNGSEIKCLGSISLKCKYKESVWNDEMFYVVDVPGPAIAGLPTCRKLQMVTIHTIYVPEGQPAQLKRPPAPPSETHQACRPTTLDAPIRSVDDLKTRYPQQFDTLGNFKGEAHLYLKDDAKPTIDAPRKCSIHLKPKLQAELDKMEKDGVIRPVTYHTDWCSSITTSLKKD